MLPVIDFYDMYGRSALELRGKVCVSACVCVCVWEEGRWGGLVIEQWGVIEA